MEQAADTRTRLLAAAADLFAEKGFEGASVSEIAAAAGTTKPLIYHYFPGKQAILDELIDSFFSQVGVIGIRFVREGISRMIEEGKLDIQEDRPCFRDAAAEADYRGMMHRYYQDVLSYLTSHRKILRIILAEALRDGAQHDALLRFFLVREQSSQESMFKALHDLDSDVYYSKEVVFRKFFFSLLPMLNYIAYAEDYRAISGLREKELYQMFIRALEHFYFGDIVGQGVWIL